MKFEMKTAFKNLLAISVITLTASMAFPEGTRGGGNLNTQQTVLTVTDLNRLTYEVPFSLRAAFTLIKNYGPNTITRSSLESAWPKLFPENGRGILEVVNLSPNSYVIQEEPCDSSQGPRDASATGQGTSGQICLSLNRLNARNIRVDWKEEILPLIAHEMGHLVGLTEQEALILQEKVSDYFRQLITVDEARNLRMTVTAGLQLVALELSKAETEFTNSSQVNQRYLFAGCRLMQSSQEMLLVDLLFPTGDDRLRHRAPSVFSRQDLRALEFMDEKLRQLISACGEYLLSSYDSNLALETRRWYTQIFRSSRSLTYQQFKTLQNPDARNVEALDLTIRHVRNVESPEFLTEIRELQNVMYSIFERNRN